MNYSDIAKKKVGLSNVDDTADIDKPVSAAAEVAINAVQAKADAVDEKVTKVISGEEPTVFNNAGTGLIATTIGGALVESNKLALNTIEGNYSGYGFTKVVKKSERFAETATPNVIMDTALDDVRFSDGIYSRTDGTISLPDAPFAGAADELLSGREPNVISYTGWTAGADTTITENASSITLADSADDNASETVLSATSADITIVANENYMVNSINGTVEILDAGDDSVIMTVTDKDMVLNTAAETIKMKFSYTTIDEDTVESIVVSATIEKVNDTQMITTAADHSKGDIVYCGNGGEEIVNGTFDSNTDGWDIVSDDTADFIHDSNGILFRVLSDDSTEPYFEQQVALKKGISYLIKFDIVSSNCNEYMKISFDNGATYSNPYPTILGTHSKVFTMDTDRDNIRFTLRGNRKDGDRILVDNISVIPMEQTYQAITDTVAGVLLNDTTKFQQIDYITRYDVVLLTKNGYKTVKGIHTFDETVGVDTIASAYGWTKLGNGLFNDGIEEVTITGLVQRLNGKMYNVAFNPLGSYQNSDDEYWYNEATANTSTYDVLNTAVNTTSGRPDGLVQDIIKLKGTGGLIYLPTYAIKPNKTDLLESEWNGMVNGSDELALDRGVEYITGINDSSSDGLVSVRKDSLPYGFSRFNIPIGTMISFATGIGSRVVSYGVESSACIRLYLVDSIPIPSGSICFIGLQSNNFLAQGENTTIDVIGNPLPYSSADTTDALQSTSTDTGTELRENSLSWNEKQMYKYIDTDDRDNVDLTTEDYTVDTKWVNVYRGYPTSWLNRLETRLSLPFNPNLVNVNTGESLIPDGTTKDYLFPNKVVDGISRVFTDDAGYSFGVFSDTYGDNLLNSYISARPYCEVSILSTVSLNTPLAQSTPLPIELVGSQVIASNSHSWHKGGGIVNAVTGKVSVGDVSKNLVSKGLENTLLDETNNIGTIPTHSPIDLDSSTSPAIKAFPTLAVDGNELVLQIMGEEVVYDSTPVAKLTADGTESVDYVADNVYEITAGNHTSRLFLCGADATATLDDYTLENDGSLRASDGSMLSGLAEWDGTGKWAEGYGEDGAFSKLTSGTITDLNGNIVRVYCGFKRTGFYL